MRKIWLTLTLLFGIVTSSVAQECISPDQLLADIPSNISYIGSIGTNSPTFSVLNDRITAVLLATKHRVVEADMYMIFQSKTHPEATIVAFVKNTCIVAMIVTSTSIFND